MHLIICNERLLFRFGVDRVLLLLAQGLKAAGWRVTFIAQRADRDVLRRITDDIHTPSPHGGLYTELDHATADWLRQNRHLFAPVGQNPAGTVALIGGWPFYGAIPVFRQWGIPTVALDCGGVPFDDMQGAARDVQQRLRALRREYLPEARAVTPISHFIARTQSAPDAGSDMDIVTIHLGADHLAGVGDNLLWRSNRSGADAVGPAADTGTSLILNLGRWEVGNYKNSEALYPIARQILAAHPTARFGVLATEADLQVPADLRPYIVALGHPSDDELARLMNDARLGLSVSRWEGFNLPLAEMQHLRKPVLVLDIGAHPEVVADAEQLCRDEADMAAKALRVLAGELLQGPAWQQALDTFNHTFTWQRTIQAYAELLGSLGPVLDPPVPRLVVDASACLRDTANTGVARVVRSLARKLQDFSQPLFVAWDEHLRAYVFPTEDEYRNLAAYGGPDANPRDYMLPRSHPSRRQRLSALAGRRLENGWLLQGEIVFERQGPERRASARELGLHVAAIFYDAIPVTHPQWVADVSIRDNHAAYMNGLADCDRVLPISPDAAQQLQAHWRREGIEPRAQVRTCWIPGELTAAPRATAPALPPRAGEPLRLLCVSTLEPRKNHQTLLAAVARLASLAPDLDWRLDLIGNRYAGADHIHQAVRQASAADPRIVWHGVVDDATLNRFYADAHVTIYPSLVEGYGMPIVESLWHGRPCLCHDGGVMAELAQEGGCVTLDMTDPHALADAIARLATRPEEYRVLAAQAVSRPILTWRSYARALLRQLATHNPPQPVAALPRQWQHLLVPALLPLVDDPGQIAIASLLRQCQPQCVVLLGAQPEWLVALAGLHQQAWQLSAAVEADGGVLVRQQGVSCLGLDGPAGLPVLLPELDRQGISPDFIVVAATEVGRPELVRPLRELIGPPRSAPGVLLLAHPVTPQSLASLSLPLEPAIELPGFNGYLFPVAPLLEPPS